MKHKRRRKFKKNGHMTPLHKVVIRGTAAEVDTHLREMRRTARSQEDFRQELECKSKLGLTALHLACARTRPENFRLLLQAGANMYATCPNGVTPFSMACHNGRTEALRMLLEFGADPNYDSSKHKVLPISDVLTGAGKLKEEQQNHQDYVDCLKLLLDSPLFDLKLHENTHHIGVHPIYACLWDDIEQDILYDFLVLLLHRGFNSNGHLAGSKYLNLALEFGHKDCATALVLAGADVYATANFTVKSDNSKKYTWNSLELAENQFDRKFAEELQQCYHAVRAVASTKRRRCLQNRLPNELVARTLSCTKELMEFGRHGEALEALASIVLMLPPSAFTDKDDRFKTLYYLVGARCLQVHFESAQVFANMLIAEFRNDPMPRLQYACLLCHPLKEKDDEENKWARTVASVAEYQLNHSHSFQFTDKSSFNEEDVRVRVKYIQQYLKDIQNPSAVAVQQEVYKMMILEEKNHHKVLEVIDSELEEETPTWDPLQLYMLKGWAHWDHASDILAGFSGSKRMLLGTKYPEGYQGSAMAKEKFESALEEFEKFIRGSGDPNHHSREVIGWYRVLMLITLGRTNSLHDIAIESMKAILEERCRGFKPDCLDTRVLTPLALAMIGDHQSELEIACKEFSIGIQLSLVEQLTASCLKHASGTLEEQRGGGGVSSTTSTLQAMLDDMSCLPWITAVDRASIQRFIDSGELDGPAVAAAWSKAASTIKENELFAEELRAQLAQLIIHQQALPAKKKGSSSRVVGTLLKEALAWNANAWVPEELEGVHEKMAPPKRCAECFVAGAHHCCPCREVTYCSKECQVKGWKKHKRTCALRKAKKSLQRID